jgi:recombination protein RecA
MFGSPETTTGGNALKFYASVRLDVRRVGSLKAGEETIGNRTRVKVVKNKLAAPFRQVEFDIIYGRGINSEGELIDIGVELGIVRKSGSWFAYGEERIGQGRDKASAYVSERPELRERLRSEILNRGAAAVQVVAGASAEA